ncbi:unnamed protein product [Lactuca virosa]|uniref:rRNA N-glycosidase n=1 Tax=Lactuca virosa TaxID=75947 RepID=A0AAU9PUL8_9ASTR|nr:unnamed protein product [Lactuca virosa]
MVQIQGFNDDIRGERIPPVRIHGVPVGFRSESNYAQIVEAFGRAIETFGANWDVFDISTGQVYILTRSIEIINGEVDIKFENNIYRVGVVEYDRDWSLFDNTTWNKQSDYENDVNV